MKRRIPVIQAIVVSSTLLATISAIEAEPPNSPVVKAAGRDTLWVFPHTHWEATVFKTREQYLEMGLHHILHALQLLEQYPSYTFVLDQVAYVKPFLERFPEQEKRFRKFVAEGRLELVLGMNVMPDVNQPGGESFVRQIQYGKDYYRKKLGVEVTTAWLLDTFGHHPQMPQILKLGGYKSFWFFRGVSHRAHPSEFLWEGIDGTRMPSVWMPFGYGMFWGAPSDVAQFEKFAKRKFDSLTPHALGRDRAAPAGIDVADPEDQLPPVVKKFNESGRDLGFDIRFGVPSQFEAAVAKRTDLPVFKGELNPIFQGTYSSRIELKQSMREIERLLTTAEKLGVLCECLAKPADNEHLWQAWEPVLFYQAHDPASGIMSDEVYTEAQRELDFARRLAEQMIDARWDSFVSNVDTRGAGTPIVVFNTLAWPRNDVAEVTLGFTDRGVKGIAITDAAGVTVPVQLLEVVRGNDGGIRQARVAFAARDVPGLGHAVFHATVYSEGDPARVASVSDARNDAQLENEHYRIGFDRTTGAITKVLVKSGQWEAIAGPANVVARQEDKGDLWELYRPLDGGSRIAMTTKQSVPLAGPTTRLSSEFTASPGDIRTGPVFSEFTVKHPFDNGTFATSVRLASGSRRIDITTRLTNNSKLVRYQALFPTTIQNGQSIHAIPFGAVERPAGSEFPAQDWVDYGSAERGIAILNVGLPGNVVTDGTMMLSLLRSHSLGNYGVGGGFEATTTSESGYELGRERSFHYALMPHAGDWRQAEVVREGLEFGHPLVCRKVALHAGRLPARWGLLSLSNPNVVVSSLQSGRDGAILLRLYEATGKAVASLPMSFSTGIVAAGETNLLGDPGSLLHASGNKIIVDLSPFQIKTLALRLQVITGPATSD